MTTIDKKANRHWKTIIRDLIDMADNVADKSLNHDSIQRIIYVMTAVKTIGILVKEKKL